MDGRVPGAQSMQAWTDVSQWRQRERSRLLGARRALGIRLRGALSLSIQRRAAGLLRETRALSIGFYWPVQGEADIRPTASEIIGNGGRAALPAVVRADRPMEFRRWRREVPLQPDLCGIPAPKWRELVSPSLVLVPVLGFDYQFHRLGYGTGYFDRTMSSLTPRPLTVGVGFELGAVSTIYPQSHDVPLDAIVTEHAVRWRSSRATVNGSGECRAAPASSPCYAAEFSSGSGGEK